MSILEFLGLAPPRGMPGRVDRDADADADTDTVRRIIVELERLEPGRARYLAAFAYVLARVAYADHHISGDELDTMQRIICDLGHLPEAQALLVVQIARSQNELFGGTEDFLVTRQFKEMSTVAERRELLDCLFAVSAADDSISSAEESRTRQIASELGIEHDEYVAALAAYSDKRDIIRSFRKQRH